jgi:hypothetical protein
MDIKITILSERYRRFETPFRNHPPLVPFLYGYKGGYTLVTLPRIVTPYRDSVDGTRDRVTYQKLFTR